MLMGDYFAVEKTAISKVKQTTCMAFYTESSDLPIRRVHVYEGSHGFYLPPSRAYPHP